MGVVRMDCANITWNCWWTITCTNREVHQTPGQLSYVIKSSVDAAHCQVCVLDMGNILQTDSPATIQATTKANSTASTEQERTYFGIGT